MCFRNVVRRILELEYSKKLCWERQARGCNGHRRELHVTIVEVYLTILLVFVSLQSLQPDNQITHRVRASERAAGANKLVAFFCCYANKKNAGKNCLAKHTFASSCNYYVLVYIVLGWAPTAWLPLHQERCKKKSTLPRFHSLISNKKNVSLRGRNNCNSLKSLVTLLKICLGYKQCLFLSLL